MNILEPVEQEKRVRAKVPLLREIWLVWSRDLVHGLVHVTDGKSVHPTGNWYTGSQRF